MHLCQKENEWAWPPKTVLLMAATRGSTLVAWVVAEDNSMYLNVTYACTHLVRQYMFIYIFILHYYIQIIIVYSVYILFGLFTYYIF